MKSPAKIFLRYAKIIELLGVNLFATRAIYRIFRRREHYPSCLILPAGRQVYFLARNFPFLILLTRLKFLKVYLQAF